MKTRFVTTIPRRRSGFAVLVLMVLLAMLVLIVAANARNLHYLGRHLRLIEERQEKRWLQGAGQIPPAIDTNRPPPAVSPPNA